MLDQSFSYENLREIYDTEKRKGHSLDKDLSSAQHVVEASNNIKSIYKDIKDINIQFHKKTPALTVAQRTKLNSKKDKLEKKLTLAKESKNDLLKKEFESISEEINSSTFKIKIEKQKNFLDPNKPFYSIQSGIKGFLFKKHIQKQLYKLYKIKQSNRYLIINQISEILSNHKTSLFNVIKVDVRSFYESVDLNRLESKFLTDDNLLSPKIKNHIANILCQYKTLSGTNKGIPRGIGISAYLGELYMRDFDNKFQLNNEIFFYARYVDDILLITAKNSNITTSEIDKELKKIGLGLNQSKNFNLRDPANKQNYFDYLGYGFTFNDKGLPTEKLNIDISEKRFNRYKEKIDLAFASYQKTASYGRMASKYLMLRVKFLVSNIRLTGEKNNIVSGIYYSNKLLNPPSQKIIALDRYLSTKKKLVKSPALLKELKGMTFKNGFDQKEDSFFFIKKNRVGENKESKEMERILSIWKDVK